MPLRPSIVSQALRFGLVGTANTAIGLLLIYSLMYFFDANPLLANAGGYAVGMGIGFALNRKWTFSDDGAIRNTLPRYLMVLALAYLANHGVAIAGIRILHMNPYSVQLLGMGVYTTLNFFGCRHFAFRTCDSSPSCAAIIAETVLPLLPKRN
jgi:putative flippase GtrA